MPTLAGRIQEKIEAGATKLGQVAAAPSRISEAYHAGRHEGTPSEAELARLRKNVEKAELESKIHPGQLFTYEDNIERIERLLQSKSDALRAVQKARDRVEERAIRKDIAELRSMGRGAIRASPSSQKRIAERIFALGGKCSLKEAIKRHRVQFNAQGKTVKFMATGSKVKKKLELYANSPRNAVLVPGFASKSKWAGRAIMSGMPSRKEGAKLKKERELHSYAAPPAGSVRITYIDNDYNQHTVALDRKGQAEFYQQRPYSQIVKVEKIKQ